MPIKFNDIEEDIRNSKMQKHTAQAQRESSDLLVHIKSITSKISGLEGDVQKIDSEAATKDSLAQVTP